MCRRGRDPSAFGVASGLERALLKPPQNSGKAESWLAETPVMKSCAKELTRVATTFATTSAVPLTRRRLLSVLGCSAALVALPAASYAARQRVRLGRTRVRAVRRKPGLSELFRRTVRKELARIRLSPDQLGENHVLSATLVELKVRTRGGRSESVAQVSATLRGERSGDLKAVLRGNARVADSRAATLRGGRPLLRAAVRGALKNLPQALRR